MFHDTISQLAGLNKLQQYTVCGYINVGMFLCFDEAVVFHEMCPTYFNDDSSQLHEVIKLLIFWQINWVFVPIYNHIGNQWQIHVFPDRGTNSWGGAKTYYLARFFAENCIEVKEIGLRGGHSDNANVH